MAALSPRVVAYRAALCAKGRAATEAKRADVIAFLRSRAGEKFFPADLAVALGLSAVAISKALNAAVSQGHANVHSEPVRSAAPTTLVHKRYWYGSSAPDGANNLVHQLVKFFNKRKRASVVSEIAKTLDASPQAIHDELLRMRAGGHVVSCERINVAGLDHLEFRLIGVPPCTKTNQDE